MGLARPIESYASVRTWGAGLREQWGGDPLAEEPEKLRSLEAFCEFAGKDPDELVAFCFLRKRKTGEKFASLKRRTELAQRVKEFRAASGRTGSDARRLQSDVLSFFVHNGILITLGYG